MSGNSASRDAASRRGALLTKVTVLQIRAELLRRRAGRRLSLSDEDWEWLDAALTAMVQTTRELVPLITADGELAPEWHEAAQGIPTTRLAATGRIDPN
jgi:hypothetical protein